MEQLNQLWKNLRVVVCEQQYSSTVKHAGCGVTVLDPDLHPCHLIAVDTSSYSITLTVYFPICKIEMIIPL